MLSIDEIKKLWLFLDSEKNKISLPTKNALKIILLTGVRTAELRLAKFQELDFDKTLWVIPAKHCKNGVEQKIHLTTLVKNLFLELKAISNTDHVLPGASFDSPLAESTLCRAVTRMHARLGLPKWTPHDLRRTFSTQLSKTVKADPVVVEKCLGHKMPKIMATYNKDEMLSDRADALEKWSCYIDKIVNNTNVVAFDVKVV